MAERRPLVNLSGDIGELPLDDTLRAGTTRLGAYPFLEAATYYNGTDHLPILRFKVQGIPDHLTRFSLGLSSGDALDPVLSLGKGDGFGTPILDIHYQDLNLGLWGMSSFGGGAGVLGIPDATPAPSSSVSGGVALYSASGKLYGYSSAPYLLSAVRVDTSADILTIGDGVAPNLDWASSHDAVIIGPDSGTAGAATTGAIGSVLIGYNAMQAGNINYAVIIGAQAGENNLDYDGTVIIGRRAGRYHSESYYSVLIGAEAGYYLYGGRGVIIGYRAGYGADGMSRARGNVIIGYQAGYSINGGENNILIGTYAGDNLTSADSCIIIGYDLDADSATGNYQLNIGGLLKGELDNKNLGLNTLSFGGGAGVLALANATIIPSSNPSGGGIIFLDAGYLKYLGPNGTVTTLANP